MSLSSRLSALLPKGAATLTLGLVLSGALTYLALIVARRGLTTEEYGELAVLWAAVFLLGGGLFQPLEQQVSRKTAAGVDVLRRRSFGVPQVLVDQAVLVAVVMTAVGFLAIFGVPRGIVERPFLGLLVACLVGFMGMQFLRGLQGGSASFGIYGVGLVLEGASRLAFVAVAVMLLPNSPLLVGAGLAGSFFVVWFLGPRTLAAPRAETVSESSGGGVWLLLFASLVESFILNVGPIVVGIASAAPEQAGRFLNGVVVARLPLMAFVAIKASLLPELTVLARRNQVGIIRQRMGHIVRLVVVVAAFTSVVVSLVGPIIVRILFGDEIGRFDFFLLAASNCGIMVPLTFSIGLAAMGRDRQLATGWALSVVAFTLCMFLPLRPFLLVEVALAVAVGVASLSMALFVRAATREPAVHDRDKRRRNVAPSSLVRADSNH